VAGSFTAGDSARKADVGEEPEGEKRVLAEGTFLPRDQRAEHGRVGHVAAVQVGRRCALVERVADAGS
jgi:hypothetical protein